MRGRLSVNASRPHWFLRQTICTQKFNAPAKAARYVSHQAGRKRPAPCFSSEYRCRHTLGDTNSLLPRSPLQAQTTRVWLSSYKAAGSAVTADQSEEGKASESESESASRTYERPSTVEAFDGGWDECGGSGGALKVLFVNAASGDTSLAAVAASAFLSQLSDCCPRLQTQEIYLWDSQLLQFGLSHVASRLNVVRGQGSAADERTLEPVLQMAAQLCGADVLLVATPMWNWSCPYVLKQYIDCVVQPGLTFRHTPEGDRAMVPGRKMVLVTSAGGASRRDYLAPYLTDVFGVVGFSDVRQVAMVNTASTDRDQVLQTAIESSHEEARRIAQWYREEHGPELQCVRAGQHS